MNSLHIEVSCELYEDTAQGHRAQLVPSPHQGGEDDGIGRRPEHIPVYLLPAILIPYVSLLKVSESLQVSCINSYRLSSN